MNLDPKNPQDKKMMDEMDKLEAAGETYEEIRGHLKSKGYRSERVDQLISDMKSMLNADEEKKNGRVFSFATAKVGEVYEHTHGPEKFKVLSIDAKKKKATVKYLDADPVDNPGLKGSTEDIDSNDTTLEFYERVQNAMGADDDKKKSNSLRSGDHVIGIRGIYKGKTGTIERIGSKYSDGTTSCDFVIDKESWDGKGTRTTGAKVEDFKKNDTSSEDGEKKNATSWEDVVRVGRSCHGNNAIYVASDSTPSDVKFEIRQGLDNTKGCMPSSTPSLQKFYEKQVVVYKKMLDALNNKQWDRLCDGFREISSLR